MDRLGQFAKEATRVSQEVGTEGSHSQRRRHMARIHSGSQLLAANTTSLVRSIVKVTKAFALGDLSKQIEVDARGEILDLKNTVNVALAAEVTRVTLELGSQSKLGDQAHVLDVEAVSFEGEIFVGTVNSMVDQLSAFSSEVTSVALGVGTQGILGGQARVEERQQNLTDQVRSISEEVTTAVALGDLGELVNVDVRGEMLDLKMTANSMVAQLSTLANEVARVSLDVRTEGILGGHAFVPDVQGMWKIGDFPVLTDNFNLMAMDLTNKVRSIAEVTKAVAGGALTKVIEVDRSRDGRSVGWSGQSHECWWKDLTDNINVMANNLLLQVRTITVLAYTLCGTTSGFDF
ncbi:hypothetical protein BYT27DRAFT_7249618 [Phlegmacium glaucopus]|nr:hypothetical protein BYT27DRAFT_7249618 [Phlegmacium glaucopus]